jgi:hypothetical protein
VKLRERERRRSSLNPPSNQTKDLRLPPSTSVGAALRSRTFSRLIAHVNPRSKGPPNNKKQGTKKAIQAKTNRLTFLSIFFFVLRVKPYARRLWTCHRMLAPAAGCGVLLYELVLSDCPFIWCLWKQFCFCSHFVLFFQRIFLN